MNVTLNKNAGSVLLKAINDTEIEGNSLEIPNVEDSLFYFFAKDSRNYSTLEIESVKLVPYIKLTANVTAWRDEPTGDTAKIKIEGNYFNGSFGDKDNLLQVLYRKADGSYSQVQPTISDKNTYSVTVSLQDLDYTKSFNYEILVSDRVSSVKKQITIQKGIPVFDWGEDDFNFNVPVTINGVDILEKLAELERLVKG